MTNIKIIPYDMSLSHQHKEFANRYWNKRKRLDTEYIYWKFRGKNNTSLNSFILALDGEKVVGQLGLIPCKIQLEDQVFDAQWACDLMVDIEYRGKGIAKELYDYGIKLKPVTLGSDPSIPAWKSMQRAGFRSIAGPIKLFFVYSLYDVLKLKNVDIPFLKYAINPLMLIVRLGGKLYKNSNIKKIDVEAHLSYRDKHISKLKHGALVVHDTDFVSWRYAKFESYYNGISCFSFNEEFQYSVYETNSVHIVTEFFAKNLYSKFKLFTTIVNRAIVNGVRKIKILANTKHDLIGLIFTGFLPFRTKTRIIYLTKDDMAQNCLDLAKKFYYTYLDSDENI